MCERGSYVCSSDRATGVACRGQGAEADGVSEHRQLLVPGGHVDGDVEGAGGEQGGDGDHDREVDRREAAADSVPGRVRDGDRETGRASGRALVCMYVKITVGGGTLTKQQPQ